MPGQWLLWNGAGKRAGAEPTLAGDPPATPIRAIEMLPIVCQSRTCVSHSERASTGAWATRRAGSVTKRSARPAARRATNPGGSRRAAAMTEIPKVRRAASLRSANGSSGSEARSAQPSPIGPKTAPRMRQIVLSASHSRFLTYPPNKPSTSTVPAPSASARLKLLISSPGDVARCARPTPRGRMQ